MNLLERIFWVCFQFLFESCQSVPSKWQQDMSKILLDNDRFFFSIEESNSDIITKSPALFKENIPAKKAAEIIGLS